MTLRLVRDSDPAAPAAPARVVRPARPSARPPTPERRICSDSAPGGLTMYTFEDHDGRVIGYVQITVAPDGDVVPRQVVELYDLCAADVAARTARMG